uniref:F-box only protein 6 n=1 Tax=Pogona vitticeps TaxID=103695 RepID=A0ABM5ENW4_9SAUR
MGLTPSRSRRKTTTLAALPDDVLLDLLALVPGRDLVLSCRLVCRRWRDLVDLPGLWRRKCQRLGLWPPKAEGSFRDWRAFYFHCNGGNLVRNPCGEDGFDFWTLNELQWTTAQDIVGQHLARFHESCKNLPRPLPEVQKCFTLTYVPGLNSEVSTKSQLINLREEGYSDQLMDKTRPEITVKDWFYTPFLAHCQLRVRLLSADFEVLRECCLMSNNEEWNEVSYTFDDYPPGVRYIDLEHEVQYRFGGKITNTTITLDLERSERNIIHYWHRIILPSPDVPPRQRFGLCRMKLPPPSVARESQNAPSRLVGSPSSAGGGRSGRPFPRPAFSSSGSFGFRLPGFGKLPGVERPSPGVAKRDPTRGEEVGGCVTPEPRILRSESRVETRDVFAREKMVNITDLPDDILIDVLVWVPGKELVLTCRLVCSLWRDLVDLPSLWKRKSQKDGFCPQTAGKEVPDWKIYYILCTRKRNLIKNPCAEEGFNSWVKEVSGGDKWKIEELPGAHGRAFPLPHVRKYFVTSYEPCMKNQLITLKAEGYGNQLMDEIRPDIVVKDWYAARFDCGCSYQLCVRLLSKDHLVLQEFLPEEIIIEQWSDAEWREISHTFHNYPPGVRYILFHHGGQDTQFWAGWYGIRVTNSSITLGPEVAD